MKVYCKDCKNYRIWHMSIDVCKLDIFKDEIGGRVIPHDRTCYNRNKNKNCPDFKARLFKKLKYRKLK